MPATTTTQSGVGAALLDRASFGPTTFERNELQTLGADAWLRRQLAPESIDDTVLEARLSAFAWMGQSAAELRQSHPGGGWRLSEDSKAIRLLRARHSRRVLFERVVDLWNDHFNVPFTAQEANFLRPVHEEKVIRRHALGSFPALLTAVATSPAMGAYLDQDSNVAGAPNENYARELLELHTLGVDGGYTEDDVREVARCFTGWGYVRSWEPGTFGLFRFDPARHDFGTKRVLGRTIGGGGMQDGLAVLRLLALHPGTAEFVARKIVRAFLGEDAAEGRVTFHGRSIVDAVRDEYLATGGSITEMLRVALGPSVLEQVNPRRRRMLKRPFHFAISFLRAIDADFTNPNTAVYAFEGLGQVPFEWPDPDGYPTDAAAWSSMLAPRWRFASLVLNGWTSWCDASPAALATQCAGVPPSAWGRHVASILNGGRMDRAELRRIQTFVGQANPPGVADLVGAFELGASSPSFQTY